MYVKTIQGEIDPIRTTFCVLTDLGPDVLV